ncbi:hypothetical protein BDV98DRAFT_651866 [Pterulicium gracile]|uniref:GST N-terminal domain-containing protein n=1 Tax=Pterulicium gracile TaxID=1884261 RepID=A0A5C3Q2Q2_9AGAR|nr:hypothetical protein BDV98DRAFT_651866 [Pterula gracilis]
MTSATKEIVYYDIASAPPVTCFAPNPWKTRYALKFKGVTYRTEWTELTKLPKSLHPLPVIHDLSTGKIVGDTFDIALYLDEAYPDGPRLIQPHSVGAHAALNTHIDAIFTASSELCLSGLLFNPDTGGGFRAEFFRRAGKERFEDLIMDDEARVQAMEQFQVALSNLTKIFRSRDEGPFLEGAKATYGDLMIGGWLMWIYKTGRPDEWEQISGWHDGLLGNLHKGLEKWAQVQ